VRLTHCHRLAARHVSPVLRCDTIAALIPPRSPLATVARIDP